MVGVRKTYNFAEFLAMFSDEFQLHDLELSEKSTLAEDCGLDSMGMYELLLILEDIGYEVDEESVFNWLTLGDVYDTCKSQMN